jgi:hypothetical protein
MSKCHYTNKDADEMYRSAYCGGDCSECTGVGIPETENTMREICKLHITYKMIKGKTVAETAIDLPISRKRYDELSLGLQPDSAAWKTVRDVLASLTFLQNYDELGAWSVDLEVGV